MQFIRKISVATIVGKVQKPAKAVELFTVKGFASGYQTGQSTFGDKVSTWLKFRGTFAAQTPEGESFGPCSNLFLPEVAAEQLREALDRVKAPIGLALKIGIKPADTTVGYEYTVESLPDDSLMPLQIQATNNLQALPAGEPAEPADRVKRKRK